MCTVLIVYVALDLACSAVLAGSLLATPGGRRFLSTLTGAAWERRWPW